MDDINEGVVPLNKIIAIYTPVYKNKILRYDVFIYTGVYIYTVVYIYTPDFTFEKSTYIRCIFLKRMPQDSISQRTNNGH